MIGGVSRRTRSGHGSEIEQLGNAGGPLAKALAFSVLRRPRFPRPSASDVANVVSAVASRVGGKFLSLAFIVILARIASPVEFASYSYLVALALLFVILTDTGMAAAAGRDLARGEIALPTVYREGLPGVVVGGCVGAVAVVTVGLLDAGPGSAGPALAFTALFVAVNAIFNYQTYLLRSGGRHWVESALQISSGLLFVATGVSVVLADLGLELLMAAFALKELLLVCVAQLFLPDPRDAPRLPGVWRRLLGAGIVISVASALFGIAMRTSQIAIGNIGSIDEIGRYSVAYRFFEAAAVACAAIGVGVGPLLCARYAADAESARRAVVGVLRLAVGLSLVLTPLAVLATPALVSLGFGERYRPAGPAAQILVATTPLLLLLFISWFALLAQRREALVTMAAAAGAAVAGLGSLLIAQRADAAAAAISVAFAVTTMSLICAAAVLRHPARLRQAEGHSLPPDAVPAHALPWEARG